MKKAATAHAITMTTTDVQKSHCCPALQSRASLRIKARQNPPHPARIAAPTLTAHARRSPTKIPTTAPPAKKYQKSANQELLSRQTAQNIKAERAMLLRNPAMQMEGLINQCPKKTRRTPPIIANIPKQASYSPMYSQRSLTFRAGHPYQEIMFTYGEHASPNANGTQSISSTSGSQYTLILKEQSSFVIEVGHVAPCLYLSYIPSRFEVVPFQYVTLPLTFLASMSLVGLSPE